MLTVRRTGREAGMTLIELMTTVSIAALLGSIAVPSFTTFLRNTEVRGSAESVMQGVQLARVEAIRRNRQVCFDSSGNGTGWIVSTDCLSAPGSAAASKTIQRQPDREGSVASVVALQPAGSLRVTFNGYGRVVPNIVGGNSISQIDVTSTRANLSRRVLISAGDGGGRLAICDPSAAVGAPTSCS
jgi:type IV fimbrial biogenesis protein FimT